MTNTPFTASSEDIAADFQTAIEVLAKHPGHEQSLITAWVAHPNPNALLAVSESKVASIVARKAAQKGLAILKAKRIEPQRPARVVHLFSAQKVVEARALFPDREGTSIVWILSDRGDTFRVCEIVINDRSGIANVQGGATTNGKVKAMFADWRSRAGRAPFAIPVDFARAKIARAHAMSLRQKRVLPFTLSSLSDLTGPLDSPPAFAHPIDASPLSLPTDDATINDRLAKSGELFGLPEFSQWAPEEQFFKQLFQTLPPELQDVQPPVSPELRAKMTRFFVEDAADSYFNDERRALYRERFKDAATSLIAAGVNDHAIDALLVSERIDRAGVVSDRPSEVPFVRKMFSRLIDANFLV